MKIISRAIIRHWVPILALVVIFIHFILVHTSYLNRWKGGGFGMYTGVHYYYNDLIIDDLNKPLDSILKENRQIANFYMTVKRSPNRRNLKKMAELASKYVASDTVVIELWKPLINSKNSTYSRELVNRYQFIKP
ncbi:MAG: hypothetical protein ACSHXF_00070 [Aquaticitalea sp.]